MSLLYPQFEFASLPKTGSTWFTGACELVGFDSACIHRHYIPFSGPSSRLRVSLVRNPLGWLFDVWNQRHSNEYLGWFNSTHGAETFEDWVKIYLADVPGEVGRLMRSYQADTFMRYEDFPEAAREFFRSLEVDQILLRHSYFSRWPCTPDYVWEQELRRQVMDAERELFNTFDYW